MGFMIVTFLPWLVIQSDYLVLEGHDNILLFFFNFFSHLPQKNIVLSCSKIWCYMNCIKCNKLFLWKCVVCRATEQRQIFKCFFPPILCPLCSWSSTSLSLSQYYCWTWSNAFFVILRLNKLKWSHLQGWWKHKHYYVRLVKEYSSFFKYPYVCFA